MSEKSVELSKLQGDYIAGIITARAQIERDFQTAVGVSLAGKDVDVVQGMQYRFEAAPPRIVYTLPEAPEKQTEESAS